MDSIERADIPVVILCGGMGTRIREASERVPKPLIDIGERPILWHIMKLYRAHGFRRFVLCLGYKSWAIKEYFLTYREHLSDFTIRLTDEHTPMFHNKPADEDWEVTLAETGLHSGTGARLRLVRDYIDTETFLFTYGDGIGNVDITGLLEFHLTQGRLGTVTGVRPSSRYGEMSVDGSQVSDFNEKPPSAGVVSGGFFVFQRPFLEYLSDDPELLIEREPLMKLARDGQLSMYAHEGFWMGMDTFREYTLLNELWDSDQAPWKIWSD